MQIADVGTPVVAVLPCFLGTSCHTGLGMLCFVGLADKAQHADKMPTTPDGRLPAKMATLARLVVGW